MAKMRLLYNNLWDIGDLTESSEQTDFPAENTQHIFRRRTWRSVTASGESIECDCGEDVDVSAVVIENHNIPEGATVEMIGADAPGGTDTTITLDVTADRMIAFLSAAATHRYWRLEVDDALAVSGDYIEIGRIYIGEYYEFPWQYREASIAWRDPSTVILSGDRQPTSNSLPRYRALNYSWTRGALNRAALDELGVIFSYLGATIPYWICQKHDADDPDLETFYVRNAPEWMFDLLVFSRWGFALSVEEIP